MSEINVNTMTLDQVNNAKTPETSEAMMAKLLEIYHQTEDATYKRELASAIHRLKLETIKKMGQAA